jgi:uncharacterized RDD family membrane protein YckC
MARWRDVKKGKIQTPKEKKSTKTAAKEVDGTPNASALDRTKAFITDMFMIMMPIMYITTYVIMGGKEDFQSNDTAHWITMGIYGLITVLFWIKKGQTPGFKAYDLKLVSNKTGDLLSFPHAAARYLMFIFSAVSVIGFLLPFFRKDRKTLQDLVCGTSVIKLQDTAR